MSISALDTLTPRELEILVLIGEGDSLPEIAQKLHRSLKTIESHRLSIGRKLNANNRVELAKIAIAQGLVSVPGMPVQAGGQSIPDVPSTGKELAWINQINDAVYNTTGLLFLQKFCRAASLLPGIEVAAICTTDTSTPPGNDPFKRMVLASARLGEDQQPMRYHAENTPCHQVIATGTCLIAQHVTERFPDDPWLKQVIAESYFGIQLIDEEGKAVGGLALVSNKPMPVVDSIHRVAEFFVPRLAGVVRTHLEIEALRAQNERLSTHQLVADPAQIAVANLAGVGPAVSEALMQIMRKVQPLVGAEFLRGLIDAMCDTFGTQYAGVCQMDPEDPDNTTLKAVFYRSKDEQGDPFSYKFENAPCQDTIEQGLVVVPHSAAKRYPMNKYFQTNHIDSYVGVRLTSPTGKVNGVTWLLDARPLDDPKPIEVVLSYFAPRISAELEQLERYEMLNQMREELEAKLVGVDQD